MTQLATIIAKTVNDLVQTQAFSAWLKGVKSTDGDLIIINNSFIFRNPLIKTSKNEQYLCIKVGSKGADSHKVFVVRPGGQNLDFKLISMKAKNAPSIEPIDQVLPTEISHLGRLVFVLIGELVEEPVEVDVNHALVQRLRFAPTLAQETALTEDGDVKIIAVKKLTEPESLWGQLRTKLEHVPDDNLSSLETAFGVAFEKLQNEARLQLVLPSGATPKNADSFLARLRRSVSEQRKLYDDALRKLAASGATADAHRREIMRIAYNFADDAINILQLLVSIADLKGVLLWCTLKEHFDVAEAFRNLPWTKSRKKPSLERYREIIGGARNRAFHNLLSFDRTIEADLKGVDVGARRLTLLPAHGQKRTTVSFDYEDREMVEILTQLTRAPEIEVPVEFWKKNATVMESFERLLERTEEALWALNAAVDGGSV